MHYDLLFINESVIDLFHLSSLLTSTAFTAEVWLDSQASDWILQHRNFLSKALWRTKEIGWCKNWIWIIKVNISFWKTIRHQQANRDTVLLAKWLTKFLKYSLLLYSILLLWIKMFNLNSTFLLILIHWAANLITLMLMRYSTCQNLAQLNMQTPGL